MKCIHQNYKITLDLFEEDILTYCIRDLREDKDLNQKTIAEMLHIHQTTYSDYERGNLNVPVTVLSKLEYFYGTSIDYLV